ncbi:MAG: photosystem I assembly BtpA, partial [Tenericutes bacterium]|nr:photosystem I assembly BtpA [Mycoplasmatota bacterium]
MKELFGLGNKTVIGMVHCLPLPGTAGFKDNMKTIITQAILDAKTLEQAGCDAI